MTEKERCLITIAGKVYDVTDWKYHHPGGEEVLEAMNGMDATDVFLAYHPLEARKKLERFHVVETQEEKLTPLQKDYREILELFDSKGFYQTNYFWYLGLVLWLATLFGATLYFTLAGESFLSHMVGSFLLGLFWQQLSFLGHDLGHNCVFHDRKKDSFAGYFVTFLLGVSSNWWRKSHNVHHVVTNSVRHDPDIQHLPVFAINSDLCRDYYSAYHGKWFKFDSIAKFFVSQQHFLYYVILSVARFNLYAQSWIHVWTSSVKRHPEIAVERYALFGYILWNLALISRLPDLFTIALYVLFSHQVCGILHVQITLSHFAMETYESNQMAGKGFVETQFATSMDVECSTLEDWFHGGLQFQVIHHIFPRLPRHNLRYVMDEFVKPLCAKHKIQYHSYSFLEGNKRVIRSLREAAKFTSKQEDFFQSHLWKFLSAEG